MKYLKMLGLAVVSAMALMAFAGAGSASANELCTENANPCPEAKRITKVEASLVGGTAKLEDTEKNVIDTCTGGGVKITNIKQGAKVTPITGEIPKEDLTWTGCTFPTVTVANGKADATHAGNGGTTITATESEVTINTFLFGTCTYGVGAGLDLGTVAAGGDQLVINKTVNRTAGGFACPLTAIWNATYTITNHSSAWYITN